MPRNVRNFWLSARIDGRTDIAAGPAAKDGGFEASVKIRKDGGIAEALKIRGFASNDGGLFLVVAPNGELDIAVDRQGVVTIRSKR